MKKSLNPALTYILSITAVLCCCFGGAGVFLSIPAYFIANNKIKDAKLNPDEYEGKLSTMETAKIIALVITAINFLYLIYTIYLITTIGWSEIQEQIQKSMELYQTQKSA